MKKKPNFDGATDKFTRCIYESSKGKVRLAVLKRDLAALQQGPRLRILDVGAGLGHMAIWFAQAGHQILLCDISEEMLQQSKQSAAEANVLEQLDFFHGGLADLPKQEPFDLVICHAVLEWIELQEEFIRLLQERIRPEGYLSLMAFNKKALMFNHFVAGNFEYIQNGMQRRSRQRLTPNWPVDPRALEQWLAHNGLHIRHCSGVRVFSDYVRHKSLVRNDEHTIIELELEQSLDPDWLPVARYLHYLLQR